MLPSPQRDADGEDMVAMANVWAHPEDLFMYLVSRCYTAERICILAVHRTAQPTLTCPQTDADDVTWLLWPGSACTCSCACIGAGFGIVAARWPLQGAQLLQASQQTSFDAGSLQLAA